LLLQRLLHRVSRIASRGVAAASQELPPLSSPPASEETGFTPHFSVFFAVPPTAGARKYTSAAAAANNF